MEQVNFSSRADLGHGNRRWCHEVLQQKRDFFLHAMLDLDNEGRGELKNRVTKKNKDIFIMDRDAESSWAE